MLATRNWEDSREKKHFESGVHMGVGAFNLVSTTVEIDFKETSDKSLKNCLNRGERR